MAIDTVLMLRRGPLSVMMSCARTSVRVKELIVLLSIRVHSVPVKGLLHAQVPMEGNVFGSPWFCACCCDVIRADGVSNQLVF